MNLDYIRSVFNREKELLSEMMQIAGALGSRTQLKTDATLYELGTYLVNDKGGEIIYRRRSVGPISAIHIRYILRVSLEGFKVKWDQLHHSTLVLYKTKNNVLIREKTTETSLYTSNPFIFKVTEFPILIEFLEKFTYAEDSTAFTLILRLKKLEEELLSIRKETIFVDLSKQKDIEVIIEKYVNKLKQIKKTMGSSHEYLNRNPSAPFDVWREYV